MTNWTYRIYLNGALVDETNLSGIANLKFESAKMLGRAELHQVYVGENFDPVLHGTVVERGGVLPPCPDKPFSCLYKRKCESDYCAPRTTAFRTETIEPQLRCGYLLRPGRAGGRWDDYDYCLRPGR